jgi:hypothetical protein
VSSVQREYLKVILAATSGLKRANRSLVTLQSRRGDTKLLVE